MLIFKIIVMILLILEILIKLLVLYKKEGISYTVELNNKSLLIGLVYTSIILTYIIIT